MAQPTWRLIVEKKSVPDPANVAWTPVLDYAIPGKLLKIVVVNQNGDPDPARTWQPKDFAGACSADGDLEGKLGPKLPGSALFSSAPRGALIGRIAGSTAENVLEAAPSGTNPSRLTFAVGRFCVLLVPTSPVGALYLAVNDSPERMGAVTNPLLVNIYEAL
jgi:hypothetical protein